MKKGFRSARHGVRHLKDTTTNKAESLPLRMPREGETGLKNNFRTRKTRTRHNGHIEEKHSNKAANH